MPRSPRVIVCNCEDLTLDDVEHCLEKGYRDIESVKRYTGFGTGICQGRNCLHLVSRILVARGVAEKDVAPFTSRPPVVPVPIGMLAEIDEEESQSGGEEDPAPRTSGDEEGEP